MEEIKRLKMSPTLSRRGREHAWSFIETMPVFFAAVIKRQDTMAKTTKAKASPRKMICSLNATIDIKHLLTVDRWTFSSWATRFIGVVYMKDYW